MGGSVKCSEICLVWGNLPLFVKSEKTIEMEQSNGFIVVIATIFVLINFRSGVIGDKIDIAAILSVSNETETTTPPATTTNETITATSTDTANGTSVETDGTETETGTVQSEAGSTETETGPTEKETGPTETEMGPMETIGTATSSIDQDAAVQEEISGSPSDAGPTKMTWVWTAIFSFGLCALVVAIIYLVVRKQRDGRKSVSTKSTESAKAAPATAKPPPVKTPSAKSVQGTAVGTSSGKTAANAPSKFEPARR